MTEHEKVEKFKEEIDILGRFFFWLANNNKCVGEYKGSELQPVSHEFLLYEYLGIDFEKFHEEKRNKNAIEAKHS